MKPGRELDALVAEKVMGLASEDWSAPCLLYHMTDEDTWCYNCRSLVSEVPGEPKRYSTDIAAAWEVVERLQRAGWVVALMNYEMRWEVELTHEGDEKYPPLEEQDTAPHAICLAALRAVGVEVDDG